MADPVVENKGLLCKELDPASAGVTVSVIPARAGIQAVSMRSGEPQAYGVSGQAPLPASGLAGQLARGGNDYYSVIIDMKM